MRHWAQTRVTESVRVEAFVLRSNEPLLKLWRVEAMIGPDSCGESRMDRRQTRPVWKNRNDWSQSGSLELRRDWLGTNDARAVAEGLR